MGSLFQQMADGLLPVQVVSWGTHCPQLHPSGPFSPLLTRTQFTPAAGSGLASAWPDPRAAIPASDT